MAAIKDRSIRGIRDTIVGDTVLGREAGAGGPAQMIPVQDIVNRAVAKANGTPSPSGTTTINLDKIGGTSTGNMLYRAASGWTGRVIGATNTFLTVIGGLPVWSTLTSMLDTIFGNTINSFLVRGTLTWGISSLTTMLDNLFGNAQGDILYRGASAWQALAPGTMGQVLQTNGAGANPSWATAASGGAYAPLVTGDLPGPALVADSDGQTIAVPL